LCLVPRATGTREADKDDFLPQHEYLNVDGSVLNEDVFVQLEEGSKP